ncbi:hypothetical protein MTR12_11100 [Staphylococcus agnetis]|uniref:epilancin biosynthesis-related protein ElxI1 n=1 Tax=Staphylococcus agnetis TaxID=985762 RepID=UPI000DFD8838|nr:hypothetical protein [Staphylococcus agnetis]MCO4356097.1 hypothetical protein [Staphylococcus agnetis]SUJ98570.1 Uncharacterised protein [Staphylococcus agnetis]
MIYITKILDFLASVCVVLLFVKVAIHTVNGIWGWNLRWYFLEDIPYMAIILFVLMFVFAVPSEMIKEKIKK